MAKKTTLDEDLLVDEVEDRSRQIVEGEESEDELGPKTLEELSKATVASSDWTAATLVQQLTSGNIDIAPYFQRREAWSQQRKSHFIESIVLGLPIPQLVLAEQQGSRGRYIVIDGKQRLLTLRGFVAPNEHTNQEPLTLSNLRFRKDLNKKTYEDLENDSSLRDDKDAFDNHTIRTVVIKNWQSFDVLRLIFYRLNTGSVQLSPQELRQALLPGDFTNFANEWTSTNPSIHRAMGLRGPDFRMRDVELFIRFIAFRTRAAHYRGNMKQFLDDTCTHFNKAWAKSKSDVSAEAQRLEAAIELTESIFGEEHSFTIWRAKTEKFENNFNRTVFDIMTFFFANDRIRTRSKKKRPQLLRAYKLLCKKDDEFVRSLEVTTKSLTSTKTRFDAWASVLCDVVDTPVMVPSIKVK